MPLAPYRQSGLDFLDTGLILLLVNLDIAAVSVPFDI